MIEREVKLAFRSADEARAAVTAAGAPLARPRRLQRDTLFDTTPRSLASQGSALRVRHDGDRWVLTYKGPVQPAAVKVREEHETEVADGIALTRVLEGAGLRPWFRYEKYREEYAWPGATLALDETPIGTFVEIEGTEEAILNATTALGRQPEDYILQSYRALFLARRGVGDMVF
jgi:adenylate cyclase class 2